MSFLEWRILFTKQWILVFSFLVLVLVGLGAGYCCLRQESFCIVPTSEVSLAPNKALNDSMLVDGKI